MGKRKMVYLSIASVFVALAFFGWQLTARSAYESAEYVVLESEGILELREYPDLMLVTTHSTVAAQGSDGSFMRLFRYISGANDNQQKVAMTTPVFMEPKRAALPDAKESAAEETANEGQMGFVIPRAVAAQRIPEPEDRQVKIQRRVGGRFAVIRFAGRMDDKSIREAEQQLRTWIGQKGLDAAGDAELAGYDPPWTPGPLRRNEILIRVR